MVNLLDELCLSHSFAYSLSNVFLLDLDFGVVGTACASIVWVEASLVSGFLSSEVAVVWVEASLVTVEAFLITDFAFSELDDDRL